MMRGSIGKRRVLLGGLAVLASSGVGRATAAQAAAGAHPKFTYQTGWPASCAVGVQSPVTFVGATPASRSYSVSVSADAPQTVVLEHNRTADFVFPQTGGGTMVVGSSAYTLESFHFHFPVEHQLPRVGAPGPAPATFELHVKAKNALGQYAVFAVQFIVSDTSSSIDNRFLGTVIRAIPLLGTGRSVRMPIEHALHLFKTVPFYSYVGSTTSPNCDPGVTWYVSSVPVPVRTSVVEQIHAALKTRRLDEPNARLMPFAGPLQSGIAIIHPTP